MADKIPEQTEEAAKDVQTTAPKTAKELATATDAFDKAKDETKKNLNDLKKTIDSVKVKDGVRKFTEALDSNQEYKKQVEQILVTPSGKSRNSEAIVADIKTLQKALGVTEDGALGPKTFKKLKEAWENRNPKDQDYKTFIDGRIRPQAEKPAVTEPSSVTEQANTSAPAISEATGIKVPDMPRMPGSQTIDNNIPPINEKSDFGHIFDSARMITADGQYTINFELDGMIIDRDARKISESKDGQSYELNIGWKGDNVAIKKDELKYAIEQNRGDVKGITLPKNGEGKPVTIIINKERISDADRLKVPKLNVQTGDALRNADPANKGQVQNPTLNIQMNNFTDTMPEIQSGIVTSIEENMSNKTVDSAIPEPDTIVA